MKTSLSIRSPIIFVPLLKAHSCDIPSMKFKGWKVVSNETSVDDKGNPVTIDHWSARQADDVQTDLGVFISDLLLSFDNRITKGSDKPMSILTCLDLDTIFTLLCGKRLMNSKIQLSSGEASLENYGKANFERFYAYVYSLDHVKEALV